MNLNELINRENDISLCDENVIHEDKISNATKHLPDEDLLYNLADLFKVFSDSTRIKILYTLISGELCVCDIATCLNMTMSAISHQLRILKQAQLIKYRRDGKVVYYSLADDHVETILKQGYDHVIE